MTSAEQQAKVAEYEARVDVLKALLAEAEQRLAFFRNVTPQYERVRRYPPAPLPTAAQPQETVAEVLADTRTDAERQLDHRSGSGENSAKLKEEILGWLGNQGLPGDLHSTVDMCSNLNAWPRFGKHVVDAILEQLVTEGVVEVERNPWSNWPRRIRLKQEVAVY